MTVTERGTKRRCASCGAAFYDLNHPPITCPKCQSIYVATPRLPLRAARPRPMEEAPPQILDDEKTIDHQNEDGEIIEDDEIDEDEPAD
ncbi:MAG: TIGR02300 family protein [Magnetospirillum sp.]|nr:TIGR02300 family protein [Magnetospirillum sp.]